MTSVYLLWHEYEIEPDRDGTKLIGVYTSHELAESAQKRVSQQPGFRDHPDDFEIAEYKLDRDHWTEGFITVD
jgi:homoserine kinase type II